MHVKKDEQTWVAEGFSAMTKKKWIMPTSDSEINLDDTAACAKTLVSAGEALTT